MRLAFTIATIVICASTTASAQLPERFEASFSLGVARPTVVYDFVCCLRTPPSGVPSGDSYVLTTFDVGGRVWLAPRFSVIGSWNWTTEGASTVTYTQPNVLPPFGSYQAQATPRYRVRAISVAPAFDVVRTRLLAPFLTAGVEFRQVERQRTPSSLLTANQQSLFVGGGLRVLAGPHVSFFADGRWFVVDHPRREPGGGSLETMRARWSAGVGLRF
jgi:hypothetical protein